MRLFYFPDACSLAVHIALRETRQRFGLVAVNCATGRLEDGRDYMEINPRGSVPALLLDDGELLTETAVILQYVVARVARGRRFLPGDCSARLRCLEWLNYVATELHKSASPLFRASTPDDFIEPGKNHLFERIDFVDRTLGCRRYLVPGGYSIADMYLFAVTRWLPALQCELRRWPGLAAHHARLLERPPIRAALAAEARGREPQSIRARESLPTDSSAALDGPDNGCQHA